MRVAHVLQHITHHLFIAILQFTKIDQFIMRSSRELGTPKLYQ